MKGETMYSPAMRTAAAVCLLVPALCWPLQPTGTADLDDERTQRVDEFLRDLDPLHIDDAAQAPEQEAAPHNPYGVRAAWEKGDWVSKGLFGVLLVMSAATWFILFWKLIEQHRVGVQRQREVPRFWNSASLDDGAAALTQDSPYRHVVERGLDALQNYHGTLGRRVDLHEWVGMAIGRAVNDIGAEAQKGLAVLATVGATAPFIGLLGTVWGIFHALTAIGATGQASIDVVAGPVGEALIMTALGLAVAVPAVMAYNWLLRRNKVRVDAIRGFAADLHTVLLSAPHDGEPEP